QLREGSLVLRNLVVEFGHCELCEQFALLDMIPDIDIALDNVTGGAGVDVCRSKGGRSPMKGHRIDRRTCLNGSDKHGRSEAARLIGCQKSLSLLRVVTQGTERDEIGQQQETPECKHTP